MRVVAVRAAAALTLGSSPQRRPRSSRHSAAPTGLCSWADDCFRDDLLQRGSSGSFFMGKQLRRCVEEECSRRFGWPVVGRSLHGGTGHLGECGGNRREAEQVGWASKHWHVLLRELQPSPRKEFLGKRESSLQAAGLRWGVGRACRVSCCLWTSTCVFPGHSVDWLLHHRHRPNEQQLFSMALGDREMHFLWLLGELKPPGWWPHQMLWQRGLGFLVCVPSAAPNASGCPCCHIPLSRSAIFLFGKNAKQMCPQYSDFF